MKTTAGTSAVTDFTDEMKKPAGGGFFHVQKR